MAFYVYATQPSRAMDANGDPVSGAKMYFFLAGTSTPTTVYSDVALSTEHSSPIVADSEGYFAPAYVSSAIEVKIRVDDASDTELYTIDYISGQPVGGAAGNDTIFTPTTRILDTDVQGAIETVDGFVEQLEAAVDPIATGGTVNSYTLNTSVTSYSSYTTGDTFLARASSTNTGACTLNVDSVGAKSLKYYAAGSKIDPGDGDIAAGDIFRATYDSTDFVITDQKRQSVSLSTEQATTSGTTKDFTIPAGKKVVIVTIAGASHDGTSDFLIQLGDSGGVETSGYSGAATSGTAQAMSAGFDLTQTVTAASVLHGMAILALEDATNFTWSCMSVVGHSDAATVQWGAGSKSLSAELTTVRVTSASADTFDAGAVNVIYF